MEQEQQWLKEYDIQDLSRALIREYLIQNKLNQTLQIFENETQTTQKKITKSALIKCLFLGSLFHNNKNKQKPLKSLLEILVQYLKNKFEQKFTKDKTKQQFTGIMSEKNSYTDSRTTQRQHQDALDIKLLETKNMESNMKKKLRPQTANPKKDSLKTFEQKLMTNTATDFNVVKSKGARKVSTGSDTKKEVQIFIVNDTRKNQDHKMIEKEQNPPSKQYEQDYEQQWQKQQEKNDNKITATELKDKTSPIIQNNQQKPIAQLPKKEDIKQQVKKIQDIIQPITEQQPKNTYQQVKKSAEQAIKNLQFNVDPKPQQTFPKQVISSPLKKQVKQPQINSRMGGMRKMGMKKISEKKIENIQPITCTTHQSKTQSQEAATQKLTPVAQYEKEIIKKQSVPKNQVNEKKMVSVFGKKKKQGKKQEPYQCQKFKFDDNFIDVPLRTVNQKYQYQPLRLHEITIATKIDQSIIYTNKPQIHHNNHAISKKKTQKNLTQLEVEELKKIVFQYNSPILPKSWHQGFILSPHQSTPYGLKQIEGGPCGIIAAVQCFYLKHLLYYSKPTSEQDIKNETRREISLVAAITDILMKVKSNNKLILTIPPKSFVGGSKLDLNSLVQVIVDADNFKSAFQGVWSNRNAFIGQSNHGVAALMYSIVTTKGIQNIKNQMDCAQNPLIGNHGHCTQQLVNLFITGKAVSNCFDGEKILQDNYKLKGIPQKSQFGFLTIFQTLKYIEVGKNLKNPIYPIWIICKQFHYHVIFANHFLIAENNDAQKFDMVYFDGLYNCGDKIIITLQRYQNGGDSEIKIKQLPLIQQVMMTKWGLMKSDWNGSVRIL